MPNLAGQSLGLTRNGQVEFNGLVTGYHTLAVRPAQGFSEIAGYVMRVGGTGGILYVEQSHDWFNFDHVDEYTLATLGNPLPFAIKTLAKFCRIRYSVPIGQTHDIRFGGMLKKASSP